MEEFKYIKSNPYPLKDCKGFFGYGCIYNKQKRYNKVNRRKLNRYYRKYGFDITECWSLDYTIMAWLSDNIGGFFRECGIQDNWSDCDLEGNTDDIKKIFEADDIRQQAYLEYLKYFLEHEITEEQWISFLMFISPRLNYLRQHTFGYPSGVDSFENWQNTLYKMEEDLHHKKFDLFIEWFFALWD
jgi:hypothetical protein